MVGQAVQARRPLCRHQCQGERCLASGTDAPDHRGKSPPEKDVIFLNYNGLDCRKKNLRAVDVVEARRHHRVRHDSYTGLKGIMLTDGTWSAIVVLNRRPFILGHFDDVEEAIEAYDQAVKR